MKRVRKPVKSIVHDDVYGKDISGQIYKYYYKLHLKAVDECLRYSGR